MIVLLVVLGLCIAGYFVGKQYFTDKEKKEEAAKKTTVLKIDTDKVESVSYTYEGKTYSINKNGVIWENKDDKKMNLKQSDVSKMVSALKNIKALTIIKKPKDITQYGFAKTKKGIKPETQEIFVKTKDGKEYDIYVGAQNPYDQSAYYIMFKGDDNVYLVDYDVVGEFQKTINELEEETATANVNQ